MSQKPKVTPEDLKDVLSKLQDADLDVVIVGGQAINLWAFYYASECAELSEWEPFSSEDLDFFGGRLEATLCHEILGGTVNLNRDFDPSPNAGVVVVDWSDRKLRIDFLATVFGLNEAEISRTARVFVGTQELQGLQMNVLHPILCLEGKLSCLKDLPQDGRQDLKHVQMSVLILQTLLKESFKQSDPRPTLKLIERVMGGATREAGLRAWYRHGVFAEITLPLQSIKISQNEKWKNFRQTRVPQMLDNLKEKRQRYSQLMERRLDEKSGFESRKLIHPSMQIRSIKPKL